MAERIWFERLPPTLVALDQWCLWKYEVRDGKPTKVPYQTDGQRASSTDPATWNTLDAVKQARWDHPGRWDGVGFVFAPDDGLVGIDLDHARGEQWALDLIARVATYFEITPSWTGYHLIARGTWPEGARHKCAINSFLTPEQQATVRDPTGAIEVYDRGRYFTVTGVWGPESPLDVQAVQPALDALAAAMTPAPAPQRAVRAPIRSYGVYEVLRKLMGARNGAKARALYNGDNSQHAGDESVADLALLEQCCWYTRDPAILDAIFRSSARMRDKWDEQRGQCTYGELTIQAALERAGDG